MAVKKSTSFKESDISIEDNNSDLTITIYFSANNSTTWFDSKTLKCTCNGSTKSKNVQHKKGGSVSASFTFYNIAHDDYGKKKVNWSWSCATGTSVLGTISSSGTKELTTISRASSVTCADGNIGSATTININRSNSNFTHTLTYSFEGLTGTIADKTSYTSIGWTIPTNFFAKIPNAKNGQGTITCQTYNGSSLIGTKTCTFNAFVINSEPTISATVEDSNATTIALTGDKNKLIKYQSNAKVTITATAKNNSTISSYKTVCAGKSSNTAISIIEGAESGTFDVSCADSRGFTSSTQITKTIVDYIKLAITNLQLSRPNTTSNTVNVSLTGNYFNANFGSVANTLSLKFRSRVSGGAWTSYTNLSPTKSGNTFSISGSLGSTYNFNNEYEFEFVATDKLMTYTQLVTVSRGEPVIDIGKDDMVVNEDVNVKANLQKNGIDVATVDDINKDSGWKDGNMWSDFKFYDNSETNRPKYRKIGKTVEIQGIVTPAYTFDANTTYTIFNLPEGYRPSYYVSRICQGTGTNIWLLTIQTTGEVTLSRYRNTTAYGTPNAGNWLPFHEMFFID